MKFTQQIIKFLDEKIPQAKYNDGTESKCIIHRLGCLFDPLD